MRIIVIFGGRLFPTETKIVVPVLPSATISELQFEAVRRARILGLDIPSTDLVLHQESPDGPIAFAEDYVEDIVDSSVPNTFWVGEAQVNITTVSCHNQTWSNYPRTLNCRKILSSSAG